MQIQKNENTIRLYQKFQFKIIGKKIVNFYGSNGDAYKMEKIKLIPEVMQRFTLLFL